MSVRESEHACVCARVLPANHQMESCGKDAVGVVNLMLWTARAAGLTVCASIISTDHVNHRTLWKQEVITSAFLPSKCSLSVELLTFSVTTYHSLG